MSVSERKGEKKEMTVRETVARERRRGKEKGRGEREKGGEQGGHLEWARRWPSMRPIPVLQLVT